MTDSATDNTERERKHFSQTIDALADLYVHRFIANLDRANALVDLCAALSAVGPLASSSSPTDILRAAVVLMHASLEELLRQLALNLLPHATEATLNEIPLAGSSSNRPEKFYLGKLKQHEDKSVKQLIEASVREHLDTSNFNSVRDITNLLRALDIDAERGHNAYPAIAEMMERRHQIVHRADTVTSDGQVETRPIDAETVLRWRQSLMDFLVDIAGPAISTHLFKKGAVERRPDGLLNVRGIPGHYSEEQTPSGPDNEPR